MRDDPDATPPSSDGTFFNDDGRPVTSVWPDFGLDLEASDDPTRSLRELIVRLAQWLVGDRLNVIETGRRGVLLARIAGIDGVPSDLRGLGAALGVSHTTAKRLLGRSTDWLK